MRTVSLGTCAVATAVTIFAPSRAMPAFSTFLPTMKPVMFCRKRSGTRPLAAELDEVRALLRRLAEQDAVVGDDADRHAVEAREAGDERRPVARLELVEARAVDDARDHLAHVVGLLVSCGMTP
jgi:hypothetical protein